MRDRVLERLDNTLDGPGYLSFLKRCERWRGMDETLSFQHDKASPHRYIPANDHFANKKFVELVPQMYCFISYDTDPIKFLHTQCI